MPGGGANKLTALTSSGLSHVFEVIVVSLDLKNGKNRKWFWSLQFHAIKIPFRQEGHGQQIPFLFLWYSNSDHCAKGTSKIGVMQPGEMKSSLGSNEWAWLERLSDLSGTILDGAMNEVSHEQDMEHQGQNKWAQKRRDKKTTTHISFSSPTLKTSEKNPEPIHSQVKSSRRVRQEKALMRAL